MKLKDPVKPIRYAPALRDGVKKICHIWWEYDGWRIEVYHDGLPQCLSDRIISNDQNLSDHGLVRLALDRMDAESLTAEAFKIIRPN